MFIAPVLRHVYQILLLRVQTAVSRWLSGALGWCLFSAVIFVSKDRTHFSEFHVFPNRIFQ